MGNFVRRASPHIDVISGNEPDHPVAEWIHNPDLSAVAGQPIKYRTVIGDTILLKTQAERDAIDAAELSARRDATAAELDAVEGVMRAFCLVLLDELNLHAARTTAILDAVDAATTLATLKAAVALIADVPQRTVGQIKTALRNKLGT